MPGRAKFLSAACGTAGSPAYLSAAKTQEFLFHRVDFGDIGCDVVIAAALPRHQAEAAAHEYLCRTRATQVNYRGQFLPSLAADPRGSALPENCREISVQEHRGKLCGMARHDPRMEQIRGTAGLEDGMVENAIAFRLRQRGIGHLVHADSARSRLVHRERIRGQAPPPIGPRSGIAGTFHLGERCQQFRRDRDGGIFPKKRRISSPRFNRGFIRSAGDESKDFSRLMQDLIN